MTSLQIVRVRRVTANGEPRDVPFKPGLNLIVGSENSSKTTTLKIIDHCLGDSDTALERFGRAIDSDYLGFELVVNANGTEHKLVRRSRGSAHPRSVEVEGQYLTRERFNDWMRERLGWPQIIIPRGRAHSTATGEQTLTFRAVYRHIFRRADSWTTFASREEEYWRQAVVAFLLGVAEQVYYGRSVSITQHEAKIKELEATRVELRSMIDDVIRRVTETYGPTASAGIDTVRDAIEAIDRDLTTARAERQRLVLTAQGDPRYDQQQDERLAAFGQEIRDLEREISRISDLHSEHRQMIATLQADELRISRALEATEVFSVLSVTICPVCTQSLPEPPAAAGTSGCHLCGQAVSSDLRTRRLELERRAARQERAELERLVAGSEKQLELAHSRRKGLFAEREALLRTLDRERQEIITPVLREFEDLQFRIGQLEQRRTTLHTLMGLQDRIKHLEDQRTAAEAELERLRQQKAGQIVDRGLIVSRSSQLARWMNEFIAGLPLRRGIGSAVTIDSSDFEFWVGRDKWDRALGEERIVAFLLAYHYAYLRLAAEEEIPHPRLAILDNPFQQDLDDAVVEAALTRLGECCADVPDAQVIVTTRRPLLGLQAHRILMDDQYNPEDTADGESGE